MTTEGATPAAWAEEEGEPAALHCYRHPDRETWVRCGRCDQPICSHCAMQGPVGFRCRQCGRPARDPLISMRPSQVATGIAIAMGGGLVVGLAGSRIGLFGLILAWFAGGVIADAILRFVGVKRGPIMAGVLVGGIVAGRRSPSGSTRPAWRTPLDQQEASSSRLTSAIRPSRPPWPPGSRVSAPGRASSSRSDGGGSRPGQSLDGPKRQP